MRRNPHKPPRRNTPLVIICLLVLAVAGAVYLNWNRLVNLASRDLVQSEKRGLQEQITKLEMEIEQLSRNQEQQDIMPPAREPGPPPPPSIDFRKTACSDLDRKIQEFFLALEGQEFLGKHQLPVGIEQHLGAMVDRLRATPPIVARETDSLFTILTNTAHFFRVLGKDDLDLVREILQHEGDSIENDLALFYQWSVSTSQCPAPVTTIALPLESLYEYAGFFLNTLGGQAYLFRRDSRLRMLVRYYCLLTIDRANAEIMNRHGIDLQPHVDSLVREIEVSESLIHRDHYLRTLRALQEKYHAYRQPESAGGGRS